EPSGGDRPNRVKIFPAPKIDKQRFRAKYPVSVVQQFRATTDGPTNLRLIVGLRKGTESTGADDGGRRITAADAVVPERVIDVRVSEAAGGVEQQVVMDHVTESATKCANPVDVDVQAGGRAEPASAGRFTVERRR